ncbi:Tn3 family transposase [Salmonella enterica subsp. enterica]|jgi:hypothetical protein|uniref:Transposase n=48 Tax=Enterobacterales TaxID=91347 RepID=D3INX1_ECOLX|nr:transposase [Escherichia coli]ASF62693.1 transposase TnAs1 (probable fusion protein) [Salmonella enterica subsp. enterica serovar Typhimurium var. monophasic 4,5,12:i:-]ASZ39750.1 Tn3 family transposase [Salmonella enterica subsp. enterica serovar Saintpaul]AXB72412.1 Relaxase/helicase [Klebsiella pneumoniae]EAA3612722.1 Tn3 family transposase [Salmonella enterica subsp. enterica serovar Mbandaka]EAA4726466.1 Tn3 family transposase [Salmonella enterica subsp. enterica]EAC1300464.1 Tn3 fami
MPRRLILSATERDTLLALPESQDDLIRYYTFNDSDLSLIRQRRGDANRLGFAVQLCLLRYPGYALGTDSELPEPVILWVAKQVQAEPASWAKYGERDVTRREHAQELRTYLQLAPFGLSDFRALDLARERQAHEAGARTRATAHERTPQQERQKAAREAERGREAWTLGQGMKKPVAGCYGRLTRWKGGGDVVYMALL